MERLNVREALRQAKRDAKPGLLPGVFHKTSNAEWLVTISLSDFMKIYRGEIDGE